MTLISVRKRLGRKEAKRANSLQERVNKMENRQTKFLVNDVG